MTAVNTNFLHNVKWQFTFSKLPDVAFLTQSINIPSISLGVSPVPTPFKSMPMPGDKPDYGELNITFKLNSDLSNWILIHNWMRGLGFPKEFPEYAALFESSEGNRVVSDCTVTVLTNANNPIARITYLNAFPTFLSDIQFDSMGSTNEIDCTAAFTYERYDVQLLK